MSPDYETLSGNSVPVTPPSVRWLRLFFHRVDRAVVPRIVGVDFCAGFSANPRGVKSDLPTGLALNFVHGGTITAVAPSQAMY